MLTKRNVKLIKSLQLKKYRYKEKLFCVEGLKNVIEVLKSPFSVRWVLAEEEFITQLKATSPYDNEITWEVVKGGEINQLSFLQSNETCIALVDLPDWGSFTFQNQAFIPVLDRINDPGNLGTIIRLAHWYGIRDLICLEGTVDPFNPKTVSAAKGSLFYCKLHWETPESLKKNFSKLPWFCASLEGKNIHQISFPSSSLVILGNEAQGIDEQLYTSVHEKIHIPGADEGAESLNVAMATAIIMDNWFRKT